MLVKAEKMFRRDLTVSVSGTGTYTNGIWVEPTPTTQIISASFHPLTGKEMKLLPENRQRIAAYKLITSSALKICNSNPKNNPDKITIDGIVYEIAAVIKHDNNILNHYAYILQAVTI